MSDSSFPNMENFDQLTGSDGFDLGGIDGFDPFAAPDEAQQPDVLPFEEPDEAFAESEDAPDAFDPPDEPDAEENITSLPLAQKEPAVPKEDAPKKVTPGAQPKAAANVQDAPANPLQAAMEQAEEKEARKNAASLFSKPPVFSHGGVNEEITDKEMTFDALRIEKSRDFSELEDAGKVSWTMEYGKTTKIISNPKKDVIYAIKQQIETSKAFIDELKKKGDKDLVCRVKPKITVQKKGIASYKAICATLEDAEKSSKAICVLPARNGTVYELRRSEVGTIIAPSFGDMDLSDVRAGFRPALPPIPFDLFCEVIAFFRSFLHDGLEYEALVHVYWDKACEEYRVVVPPQWVQKASVDAVISLEDVLDEERYIHFADIHSHNTMAAKFSATDDADEKASRVYIVVGRLHEYFPHVSARVSCNGVFVPIPLSQVVTPLPPNFPAHWSDAVQIGQHERAVG